MMNVQVFNNEEFGQVRTVTIEDEFYFNLKDCCRVLDIKNHKDAASRLNQKGVVITDLLTNGGVQKANFINESNFYKLVFQSRKPEAEKFADWVTDKVLPAIRKHGAYIAPAQNALTTEDAFIQLFQTQKEIKQEQAVMRDDIVYLKEEQPVNPSINQDLTKERNKAVVKCLGGYDAPAYSDSRLRQKVFCQAAKEQIKLLEENQTIIYHADNWGGNYDY